MPWTLEDLVAVWATRSTWGDDLQGWRLSIAQLWQDDVHEDDEQAIDAYVEATKVILLEHVATGHLVLKEQPLPDTRDTIEKLRALQRDLSSLNPEVRARAQKTAAFAHHYGHGPTQGKRD